MANEILRRKLLGKVSERAGESPVVMILGPRQCGKTTLARRFAAGRGAECFDLENPADFERLGEPMTALEPLRGWVVIDEAQIRPEVFRVLRVLADREGQPAQFLLLGSASPDLVREVSESLAGRVALVGMGGFGLDEVGASAQRALWWRGGFPRSFLAETDAGSRRWRADFIQTFLERDLRRLGGIETSPQALRRFWMMVAHYHGQIWNASEIGRSLGHSHTTIKRYLDILCGAFVMRSLLPWFENVGKRQVKSPKVFVRDSGLLHELLGLDSIGTLEGHPKLGASWEGFAQEETLRLTGDRDAYFWATQGGAELDLLVFHRGRRIGFEFKYADAPKVTRSMSVAREDLGLERLFVVHPGKQSWPLKDWAEAVALTDLASRWEEMAGSA